MMAAFRKRLPVESINKLNEAIALSACKSKDKTDVNPDDSEPEEPAKHPEKESSQAQKPEASESKNQGKLLMDATCTPADIRYPTDLNLLNTARKKTEQIIDRLHQERPKGTPKPRTYRKIARKAYLKVVKKKSPSTRLIRKAIRKQLGFVRRNLKHIEMLAQTVSFKV
jgi:flagellar motor protein MotB